MVLVVGATGLVGSEVCLRLAQRGERVKALVRETSSAEKVAALRSAGVETCIGDLKDATSLRAACQNVEAVISTASSTLSRQPGDSIESVDAVGQMNLVEAAQTTGVNRFIFLSFRDGPRPSPLSEAKGQVENAISSMNFTAIRPSYFMEVWLSPTLGFDYANAKVRIYGAGTSPLNWVSSGDVAEMCALSLRHPAAEHKMIEFGGPEALSPLEVVKRFEEIGGRKFVVEHVPVEALTEGYDVAPDAMQKSFMALMLAYANGDVVDMTEINRAFGIKLTDVSSYARRVLGVPDTAFTSS